MPESPQAERFRLADLIVDTATRQVWRDGVELPLTGLSFDLLRAMMSLGTRVVSVDELMDRVWPGRVVNAETVGKRVELVREALGDDSLEPRYIALVRGHGYRLLHAPQPADTPFRVADAAMPVARETTTSAIPGTPVLRPRRRILVSGFVLLAALAVIFIIYLWRSAEENPTPATVAANHPPSVAVLPFLNLSDDSANSYFSDGMAEELLTTLSKMRELRVASRTSAFTFRGSRQSLPEIARALNVDHIVEGSVRKAGNRMRITVQLIDVGSDSHLWAETYDRELADVLEIQREIAEKIASALKVQLSQDTRARLATGTQSAEAYQLYLRGQQLWQARTEESIRQSLSLLGRAVEIDPGYAQAHSSLAAAHLVSFFWYAHPEPSSLGRAEEAAQRAITLDPTLSQPYAVRAELAETRLEWIEAEARFRRALELNPNDVSAGYWYAVLLQATGRTREALAIMLKYEPLDPISPALLHDIGMQYARLGDDVRACEYYRRTTQISRSPYPWLRMAECHERQGNIAAAEQAELTAQRRLGFEQPIFTLVRESKTNPAAARAARQAIAAEQGRQRVYFANTLWKLGDLDASFDAIEHHVLNHDFTPLRDLWWREARDLRAHPRFHTFVEKIGLVDYWRKSGWPDICRPAGESFTCD